MSDILDRAPQRIAEWLSLQDISRAWNEETGEDAAVFEAGFRTWFKDFLVRNAYGEAGGEGADAEISTQLLEGRQIWRETFETFCEERGLAKPRFWFPEAERTAAISRPSASEPVPIAEAEAADPAAAAPVAGAPKAPNRRRAREGSTSFTWIAAGLVVAVASGLVALWLQDMDAVVADADIMNGAAEEAEPAKMAPADSMVAGLVSTNPALTDPASNQTASAVIGLAAPAATEPAPAAAAILAATPAPTTPSDPAAAQIAAAPIVASRTDPGVAPTEAPATLRLVAGEVADQGLVLLLQRELQMAGYDPGPLDGVSGAGFAAAITAYQRANKLRVDGRASIELLSRLARENLNAGRLGPPVSMTASPDLAPGKLAGPAPASSSGTRQDAGGSQIASLDPQVAPRPRAAVRDPAPKGRELVRAIQKRLSDRGYYEGTLDGSLGPRTREAIETYQRVQRYAATGRPSHSLYEELEDYALDVRGLKQFRTGAYDAAVSTYTRIIRRNPNKADAYFNRGLAYKNTGRTDQALSDYGAAIALDPTHRKAYFDRANIRYRLGLYGDAIRDYFKALRLLLSFG